MSFLNFYRSLLFQASQLSPCSVSGLPQTTHAARLAGKKPSRGSPTLFPFIHSPTRRLIPKKEHLTTIQYRYS